MSHTPFFFHNVGLHFPQKICFEGFTTQVQPGSRIALIGQNGSGKSSLLRMIQGNLEPSQGELGKPKELVIGFVPQVIEDFNIMSGGERLNASLTQALALQSDVLLLDEPTNHLDYKNRKSLIRLLQSFQGTLIIASHDVELLRSCIHTFWHIEGGKVHIFSGRFDDLIRDREMKRSMVQNEINHLNREKTLAHKSLMKEQSRAARSREKGVKSIEKRKWPTIVSREKARRAVETTGRKKAEIRQQKDDLFEQLSALRLPEIIKPTFSLSAPHRSDKDIVSIREGSCGYDRPILQGVNFTLGSAERMAINGDNGCGKTTLLRAILSDKAVKRGGEWSAPHREDLGYLDQHYGTLSPEKTVLETLQDICPTWPHGDIRKHLNDFLFRKNEEVNALVKTLSGGEKARLSLAQIAGKTPRLLILDEITNNLDLETREHVIQVLKEFPGAMIIVSHDMDFLSTIQVDCIYKL